MTIKLRAADGDLPLGFLQYETLRDGVGAYELDGRPIYGARLNDALAGEGIGEKTVAIAGRYASEGGSEALARWRATVRVAGTLDNESLARIIHAKAREFSGRKKGGQSPAEVYVVGLTITSHAPAKPLPKSKRGARREFVKVKMPNGKLVSRTVYRDKSTGRFTSRETWNATRKRTK